MNSITDKAIAGFRSGLNCAQAVLTAYTDDMQFDRNLAVSIACGFGGGMGRLQETCGAVTGSFMVMGVHNCKKFDDKIERKEKTYAMVQEFSKRFLEKFGTMDCKTLLNCDLKTEEGHKYMKVYNLSEKVCEKCIADSVEMLNEIIEG